MFSRILGKGEYYNFYKFLLTHLSFLISLTRSKFKNHMRAWRNFGRQKRTRQNTQIRTHNAKFVSHFMREDIRNNNLYI